jgi:hypothetical protein
LVLEHCVVLKILFLHLMFWIKGCGVPIRDGKKIRTRGYLRIKSVMGTERIT